MTVYCCLVPTEIQTGGLGCLWFWGHIWSGYPERAVATTVIANFSVHQLPGGLIGTFVAFLSGLLGGPKICFSSKFRI